MMTYKPQVGALEKEKEKQKKHQIYLHRHPTDLQKNQNRRAYNPLGVAFATLTALALFAGYLCALNITKPRLSPIEQHLYSHDVIKGGMVEQLHHTLARSTSVSSIIGATHFSTVFTRVLIELARGDRIEFELSKDGDYFRFRKLDQETKKTTNWNYFYHKGVSHKLNKLYSTNDNLHTTQLKKDSSIK